MIPEFNPEEIRERLGNEQRDINNTFTDLVLNSGSSDSNLGGGIYLKSLNNNTCRAHVQLHINYKATETDIMETGGNVKNYTTTLTPHRWYKGSLVVDSVSEQVQLYLN